MQSCGVTVVSPAGLQTRRSGGAPRVTVVEIGDPIKYVRLPFWEVSQAAARPRGVSLCIFPGGISLASRCVGNLKNVPQAEAADK